MNAQYDESLSEEGKDAVAAGRAMITDPKMEEQLVGLLGQSKDFAKGATVFLQDILSRVLSHIDVPPDEVYRDRGVAEHLLQEVARVAQENGMELDENLYDEVLDRLEQGSDEQGGHPEEQEDPAEAAQDQPQQQPRGLMRA